MSRHGLYNRSVLGIPSFFRKKDRSYISAHAVLPLKPLCSSLAMSVWCASDVDCRAMRHRMSQCPLFSEPEWNHSNT